MCATGNFAYFDNTHTTLRAEHFMASGALPPGFAAVEIDGEYFWDGGLMSNTPLYEVMQATPRRDTLAFQVDLWSASGPVPDSIVDVMGRMKDIQYSSRTRLVTDMMQRSQRFRHVLRRGAGAGAGSRPRDRSVVQAGRGTGVFEALQRDPSHLPAQGIRRALQGLSVRPLDHARALGKRPGRYSRHSLAHRDWLDMPNNDAGFVTHDIHRDGR